jgi:hypothetical protein
VSETCLICLSKQAFCDQGTARDLKRGWLRAQQRDNKYISSDAAPSSGEEEGQCAVVLTPGC